MFVSERERTHRIGAELPPPHFGNSAPMRSF